MYVLKGFAAHAGLEKNAPGQTNNIGEISTQSLTYSREKGYYNNGTVAPGLLVISFVSEQDGTQVEMDDAMRDQILTITKFAYDITLNDPNTQKETSEFLTQLTTQFGAVASKFTGGKAVTDGRYWMPEYLSWESKLTESTIKLWFSNNAFARQYDEYDYTFVSPIWPLDDFFKRGDIVEQMLKSKTISQITAELQAAKNNHPETVIRVDTYDYHDPIDKTRIVPSNWGILIYGLAGNNIDAIKDGLIDWILGNSTHTRDEWAEILPDIFKKTEFMLIPFWDKYAIPNRTDQTGIYSPIVSTVQVLSKLKEVVTNYPSAHINANAESMSYHFKQVSIASIGGPENRDGLFKLDDIFPDFLTVSTTSQDFNRMSVRTREFGWMLANMVVAAEEFTEYSDIPTGMMKTVRNGRLYLAQSFENITYLVLAKASI